jgi:hypothetical protein
MKKYGSLSGMVLVGLSSLAVAAAGCGELEGEENGEGVHSLIKTDNGLTVINGLTTINGLASGNGLSTINGLATVNGLASANGLMTSAAGRNTVTYLVRCALPAGITLVKKDQYGTSYSFPGEMGLAPQWRDGSCDTACQEKISSCMLAHINTAGVHVPLWVVSQDPSVGWKLNPLFPNQEGSFFGNIFVLGAHGTDPKRVAAYYCNGIDYKQDVVPGRIGANQVNAPYVDPFGGGKGYCKDYCTAADSPYASSGFKACAGWNNVMTVWRQAQTGSN